MAKVAPYRTLKRETPAVYHDHANCPDGRRIKAENRVADTGGRQRCGECENLD